MKKMNVLKLKFSKNSCYRQIDKHENVTLFVCMFVY